MQYSWAFICNEADVPWASGYPHSLQASSLCCARLTFTKKQLRLDKVPTNCIADEPRGHHKSPPLLHHNKSLTREQLKHLKEKAFTGYELVQATARVCAMVKPQQRLGRPKATRRGATGRARST